VDSARDYLRQGLTLQRDLLLQWNLQAVDPLHVILIGIAALYKHHGQHDVSLELLVILLHHPQRGGDSERKARALLAQWQSHLPLAYFQGVMEAAKQEQLVSRYIDPQFTISLDVIDRLLQMIQSIAVA
jgi:hypothetical protein